MTHSNAAIGFEAGRRLDEDPTLRTPSCVVCGSFRRDPLLLGKEVAALRGAGCRILSPVDPNFVAERDGFVFAAHESDLPPASIEASHMRAMEQADFVW